MQYRSLKSVRAADKQTFEGLTAAWTQIYVELENVLDAQLAAKPCAVKPGEDGAAVAARVRSEFRLDDAQRAFESSTAAAGKTWIRVDPALA